MGHAKESEWVFGILGNENYDGNFCSIRNEMMQIYIGIDIELDFMWIC